MRPTIHLAFRSAAPDELIKETRETFARLAEGLPLDVTLEFKSSKVCGQCAMCLAHSYPCEKDPVELLYEVRVPPGASSTVPVLVTRIVKVLKKIGWPL